MNIEARQSRVSASIAFAGVGAACAVALGTSILIGWITGIEGFRNFLHPQRVSMNAAPAVCFVLTGVALWLTRDPRRPPSRARDRARVILATLAVLIAAAKFLDLLQFVNLPVDRILFRASAAGNRMSPNTALCFLLVGASLMLLEWPHKRGPRPSTVLALLVVAMSALALTGYLYHVQALYRMGPYKPMSPNTSVGMLLLAVGILCARPTRQPVVTLISGSFGGVVARRLLPVAILLPVGLGWLKLRAERAGVLDNEAGILLFALLIVATFLALTWLVARSLYRLDIERAHAEARVADNYQLMRTLIDNLPDRIFAKDRESRFLVNNASHLRVLGAERPEDVRGKTDEHFFPPEVARPFLEEEHRIVETGEGITDQEQRRTSRTGEERWVTVTKVPFRNAQGEVAGIVGITHDVTALKHAQSLLREQNEMLEETMRSEHEAHE